MISNRVGSGRFWDGLLSLAETAAVLPFYNNGSHQHDTHDTRSTHYTLLYTCYFWQTSLVSRCDVL